MEILHIVLLASIFGFASSSNNCHACLEGICYSKTPIIDGKHFSGQLAVDRTENIVYFHYEDSHLIDYTAAFDLDDVRLKVLPNVSFSFAKAVDQSNRAVYIGGTQGIYKYNPYSNKTTRYALFDKTIWQLQYKNKMYYTIFKSKGLYTYQNKQSKSVSALANYTIDDFVIDNREDIYFLSQSRVYRLRNGGKQATVITDDIYSLSIDKFESVHLVHSGKRGLYNFDSTTDELIELGAFGSGIPVKSVFDNNNNIIYTENNSMKLYYLMPNYGRCVVTRNTLGRHQNSHKIMNRNENIFDYEFLIHRLNE